MKLLLILALIWPLPGSEVPQTGSRCLSVTRTLFVREGTPPRRLILKHPKGEIRISSAGDVRNLSVQARLRNPAPEDDESTIGLSLTSHNGTARIRSRSGERIIDLDIRMPDSWGLRLKHGELGDIFIHGLCGEMEIQSLNGSLHLESVSGPILASTEEGDITASFISIPPATAMALISVAGRVSLSLPGESNSRIHMRSRAGRIRTDFPISGIHSGWTEVLLGDGGPLIRLESMDNHVSLHRIGKKR